MGTGTDTFHAPRTVKTRRRLYKALPVIAIHRDTCLDEDGEVSSLAELVNTLPRRPSAILATVGSPDLLALFDETYKTSHPTSWNWRTSEYERDMVTPDGKRVGAKVSVVIPFLGWKGGNYHKMIDPVTMYGRSLDEIWPAEDDAIVKLLRWGVSIRDFCRDSGIDIRPTVGGMSSQFMTDPRFYNDTRRKVPAKINRRSRDELPGNFYELSVDPGTKEYRAHYLDQRRAHHYHARTLKFPSSNTLYAYGSFRDLKSAQFSFDEVYPHLHGLYCVDLQRTKKQQPFAWLPRAVAQEKVFIWSNEVPHLLDSGYRVIGVRAAWGSTHLDTGLRLYAQWADKQLDQYGDHAWLKPLLLSAYGTLAIRPRYAEAVFRLAKSGKEVTFRTGKRSLSGKLVKSSRKLEPGIANVLHRGMIEAATRSESIGLAQYLSANGHAVLSIYADAVMVEQDDDNPLPLIPEPWRNKRTLNRLQFVNQQAFISDGMTKLPGVGRELREYRSHFAPGYAPRKALYEALTGRTLTSNRRI